jgi:signal transduction histidine kinase
MIQSSDGAEPDAVPLDVEELIQQARDAGLDVSLDIQGSPPPAVHATVHRSAQRIVQESLTNARKHAPGSQVSVNLCYGSDEIELRVENVVGSPQDGSSWASSGHGLLGIRERVAMLGGQVRAGLDDGMFVVHARLPLATG